MKAIINRIKHEDKQTLGVFQLFDGLEKVFEAVVLELPDKDNRRSISRITQGEYTCVRRYSPKYNWHYMVKDVKGRDFILIHFGNYYKNTRGCLLLGRAFRDLNKDGYMDVTSSKKTMKKLVDVSLKSFKLYINDN